MAQKIKHKRHDFVCIITKKGKLLCRRSMQELRPLTRKQKTCASKFIAQEMSSLKKGSRRVKSKAQAVAIGLSRARKECG